MNKIARISIFVFILIGLSLPSFSFASSVYARYCSSLPTCNTEPTWNGSVVGSAVMPISDALVNNGGDFQTFYTSFGINTSTSTGYFQLKNISTYKDCTSIYTYNPSNFSASTSTKIYIPMAGTECTYTSSSYNNYTIDFRFSQPLYTQTS